MDKKKPVFSETIKKTSLFILGLMVLNILRKLIFKFDDFVELKNQFLESDQKGLIALTLLATMILGWIVISLIAGSLYFFIKTMKYNKSNKDK